MEDVFTRWFGVSDREEKREEKAVMKERYDYRGAMAEDIRNYIKENEEEIREMDEDERFDTLYEDMLISDSITGNASGSYTFNSWRAEEYLCHNWDLLEEAMEEFESTSNILKEGAETCDVIIRCYLLNEVLAKVLDEYDFEEGE